MKDYTLKRSERATFIKKYEIHDESIVVYLANHKCYNVPYSVENEKLILERMEVQVKATELTKYSREFAYSFNFTALTVTLALTVSGVLIVPILTLPILGVVSGIFTFKIIRGNIIKKDIEKSTEFLDMKAQYNEELEKLDSSYTKDKFLNINNIARLSLRELRQIRVYIENEYALGETKELKEEKEKVRTLSK